MDANAAHSWAMRVKDAPSSFGAFMLAAGLLLGLLTPSAVAWVLFTLAMVTFVRGLWAGD